MKTETINIMGHDKRCAWVRFVRFHPSTGHNAGEEVPFPVQQAKAIVASNAAVWMGELEKVVEPVFNDAVAAPVKPKASKPKAEKAKADKPKAKK